MTKKNYEAIPKEWTQLQDGGSDQWLWVANDGPAYVFIEIIDFPAYMGGDATSQWDASVSVVDLDSSTQDTRQGAFESYGIDFEEEAETPDLAIAEMLLSYGAKSPMWNDDAGRPAYWDERGGWTEGDGDDDPDGDAFQDLLAEALQEATKLLREDVREDALDGPAVNGIGQSPRQYAQGTDGLWDALRTIQGDPEATVEQRIILKMYQNVDQTLDGSPIPLDLQEISADIRRIYHDS